MRSKGLGRKDKYERNLETGKFLKPNPILAAFKKIDEKMVFKEKQFGFDVLTYLFRRNKLNWACFYVNCNIDLYFSYFFEF